MSTGFLLTGLTGKLKSVNDLVNQHFIKKLYIYVSLNNQPNLRISEYMSQQIVNMYAFSTHFLPNIDVRIIITELKLQNKKAYKLPDLDVDLILLPKNYNNEKVIDIANFKKETCVNYIDEELPAETAYNNDTILNTYQNVVLGGTFDRLHNGHKILLTEALLRCSTKITVGVTDENMIKGKKLFELIEPSAKRVQEVEKFIKEVDPTVDCEVVIISDLYGPTKYDKNLNMIVVSSETINGAQKINELRKDNGLDDLEIHIVNLVDDTMRNKVEEQKVSSSNHRIRLLGTYIKMPQPNLEISARPYKIGLTGGIASGKSTIADYLRFLGAGVIDCDKIAHQLYKPETDLYFKLIKSFGTNILLPNGEINRKELGAIAFNNPSKLQLLNDMVWPEILNAAMIECDRMYHEEKKKIVVLEAALLLKANWHQKVHEIWGTIISEDEAVSRLMKRNNLSETEAKLRIRAQTTNQEIVNNANIIFCSLWSHEFTREQVMKAWNSVQVYVES